MCPTILHTLCEPRSDACNKSLNGHAPLRLQAQNARAQSIWRWRRPKVSSTRSQPYFASRRSKPVTRQAAFDEVEISALFENITDAYAAAAEDQGKAITANVAPALTVWGDRELLAEMLANLLDNAIRHTPPGTNIEVTLANGGTSLSGTVAEQWARDTARGTSSRLSKVLPHGTEHEDPGPRARSLLVAAVAELHGIELSAEDNAPGLRMAMSFGSTARPGDARLTR